MLTVENAARELLARGHDVPHTGMDDPTEAGIALRWWWDGDGILCCAWWRGATSRFPGHTLERFLAA